MKKIGLLLGIALVVVGCAAHRGPMKLNVSAINQGSSVSPADAAYQSASAAIYRRDYAQALDLLQIARDKSPNDARVLNAFGVVYDKLGRFDLSQRYYAAAGRLDPGSTVVANNLAYSHTLQQDVAGDRLSRPTAVALARPAQVAPVRLAARAAVEPAPTVAAPAKPALKPTFVVVLNASGVAASGDTVRTRLRNLGWSARDAVGTARQRPDSLVTYPTERKASAIALARTLGAPVKMVECTGCKSIQLAIGADAAHWRLGYWLKPRATRQDRTA